MTDLQAAHDRWMEVQGREEREEGRRATAAQIREIMLRRVERQEGEGKDG